MEVIRARAIKSSP